MAFTFVENGSHAAICYGDQEILKLDQVLHFFACQFWVRDQVLVPGGRPEVASVPMFSGYGHAGQVTTVAYEASQIADGLRLTVRPTGTARGGGGAFACAREEVTLEVRLAEGRFVWRQAYRFEAVTDVDPAANGTEAAYSFYRMPRPDGLPGVYVQFADPQPTNASGPAVPMTHDWLEHHEPYVGPDTFRAHWKRDYVTIAFEDPDGLFRASDLNKTKWHNLTIDNRRARLCRPEGRLFIVRDDGSALEYAYRAPSHFHHVCEWGMDFHFWADVEPFLVDGVLPAGTVIQAETTVRLVDAEVVQPVLEKAVPIELTARERQIADRPAYEEPENTFTVSALDRLDAQPWTPGSEGCRWERTGGHAEGHGCLVVCNEVTGDGEWVQSILGPSQWGNPFVPGARYRLSAWVRMDELRQEPNWPIPMIGAEFHAFNGPGSSATRTAVPAGWSQVALSPAQLKAGCLPWTHLELITIPCPSYVLVGALRLRVAGRGTAFFSGVRWELVQ